MNKRVTGILIRYYEEHLKIITRVNSCATLLFHRDFRVVSAWCRLLLYIVYIPFS